MQKLRFRYLILLPALLLVFSACTPINRSCHPLYGCSDSRSDKRLRGSLDFAKFNQLKSRKQISVTQKQRIFLPNGDQQFLGRIKGFGITRLELQMLSAGQIVFKKYVGKVNLDQQKSGSFKFRARLPKKYQTAEDWQIVGFR